MSEQHPDLFTPDEARAYLKLSSVETLRTLREKKMLVGYEGYNKAMIYYREDLDACALRMVGRGNRIPAMKQEMRMAK